VLLLCWRHCFYHSASTRVYVALTRTTPVLLLLLPLLQLLPLLMLLLASIDANITLPLLLPPYTLSLQDSFVHTLGNYLRQTGAEVTTVRAGPSSKRLFEDIANGKRLKPDLAVLSPGPGNPRDFDLTGTLSALEELQVPGFGVCLGLQGVLTLV
jgi:hypothetical protein